MTSVVDAIDVEEAWTDMQSAVVDEDGRMMESMDSDGSTQRSKKPRTANYKKLNALMDAALLEYAVYVQLHEARLASESRLNELRTPAQVIGSLSVAAFRTGEICSTSCDTEKVPIVLYLVQLETEQQSLIRMKNARHMFLSTDGVMIAGRLGMLTTSECEKCTIHVCSPYCPYSMASVYPELFASENDEDAVWNNSWWHKKQIDFDHVPSSIYRCMIHNKFHICANVCEYMFDGRSGTKVCPISQRAVTDEIQHSFGDGVGTAEQQEKTAEAKGLTEGGDDNERRRKSMSTARIRLLEAATVVVGGVRVRRSAGVRSTTSALRRKAGKAKKFTPEDQQTVVNVVVTAPEAASCRPFNYQSAEPEQPTTVAAIAQVPFSERTPRYDRQFAMDRLHAMYHRAERRRVFTLPDIDTLRWLVFGDVHVFAKFCERAGAIFHQLLLGKERIAIEQARYDKARPKAERAVEQYITKCNQSATSVFASTRSAIYESTINTQTRRFPLIELSAEMRAATEAYYAMRAVMFYFGLLALPVRNKNMMRADEIETIRTAFSFESFCVIIYDLMRTGYVVRNVTLLARDTFLVERLFPSSSVLRQMGMFEKPCTNIKGLITTILKVAQPRGISFQYVMDTTLTWPEIAELSMQPDPARRVVEALVTKRREQLHALRLVEPPSPEREIKDE